MSDQDTRIGRVVQLLKGSIIADASIGVGSVLLLDFGNTDARSAVVECVWRLSVGERIVCASEDDRERLREASAQLKGDVVEEASVSVPGPDLRVRFRSGLVLEVFSLFHSVEDGENWTLLAVEPAAYVAEGGVLIETSSD